MADPRETVRCFRVVLGMSRRLRFVPRPMVVEVTCRTIHGRFLLQPSPRLNRLAVGVLARAQRMYGMRVHAFCIMSNHYHLLLSTQNAFQLARFMNFVQSNLAREAGRLARWRAFRSRRYQAILVGDESAAQLSRLRYVLSQGCKEGIVARPEHWRGAQCVRELLTGQTTLRGEWIDRTAIYREDVQQRSTAASKFISAETLVLSELPCFEGISERERLDWIRRCVEQIVAEARVAGNDRSRPRQKNEGNSSRRGTVVVEPLRRSPAPWFHVASAGGGHELRVAYALFLAMFRSAANEARRGLQAIFPEGSFPPARPYVST